MVDNHSLLGKSLFPVSIGPFARQEQLVPEESLQRIEGDALLLEEVYLGIIYYSLQMFEGSHPTRSEYHDYPGEYSYKYPKAGQDNSKVSLWSYDMKNGKTVALDVPVISCKGNYQERRV